MPCKLHLLFLRFWVLGAGSSYAETRTTISTKLYMFAVAKHLRSCIPKDNMHERCRATFISETPANSQV